MCSAREAKAAAGTMRITFATEGGVGFFPGLARPVTIEVDALAPDRREELRRLVDAARFFERPEPKSRQRGADRRTYSVTVAAAGRERTLRLTEPVEDPSLAELIALLRQLTR